MKHAAEHVLLRRSVHIERHTDVRRGRADLNNTFDLGDLGDRNGGVRAHLTDDVVHAIAVNDLVRRGNRRVSTALAVFDDGLDLHAENAALGVPLFDRQQGTGSRRNAERGDVSTQGSQDGHFHRLGCCRHPRRGRHRDDSCRRGAGRGRGGINGTAELQWCLCPVGEEHALPPPSARSRRRQRPKPSRVSALLGVKGEIAIPAGRYSGTD